MRSFVCKHFHPNWFRVVFQFCDRHCEMSLWMSNMTLPPWIFLSFLYTLYGQVSGKSSEVAIELSILVSWIATTCGWLKSRKASSSSFLPLMLLIFMLMNFNPLIKLPLFVPQGEDLSFFSFVRGTNLFSVSKFTCSPKKESETGTALVSVVPSRSEVGPSAGKHLTFSLMEATNYLYSNWNCPSRCSIQDVGPSIGGISHILPDEGHQLSVQ